MSKTGAFLIVFLLCASLSALSCTGSSAPKETIFAAEPVETGKKETKKASAAASDTETASAEEAAEETEAVSSEETEAETEAPSPTIKEDPRHVRLVAVGDMLMHAGITNQAVQPDGSLNYDFLFKNVLDDMKDADLAVLNNEVIFGGDELGALGYPRFNVPSALGDAEVRAGFNVILSAGNHTNDQGAEGIRKTLDFWSGYPDTVLLGIHATREDALNAKTVEVNGIRIAMINLTYGLNIDWLPEGEDYLVDLMIPERRTEIADQLQRADRDADFVIVFPHWGEEYDLVHNEKQREWAEFFAENGADLIIGAHTHTIQENEWVTAWNGNTAYCVYSLGNFVSIQAMTINMPGKMQKIVIEKDSEGCRISEIRNDYTFTYFNKALTDVQVFKMDQVTEEMLASHGVVGSVHSDFYDGMNAAYPLTMETLKNLCK